MLYIILNASRTACGKDDSVKSIQIKDAIANTLKILKIYLAALFASIAMILSSYTYFKCYEK